MAIPKYVDHRLCMRVVLIATFRAAALTGLLALSANCLAVDISGNHTQPLIPEIEIGANLDQYERPVTIHSGHAIEIGIAQTKSSGIGIVGSQPLSIEHKLTYSELAYRWRKFPWEGSWGVDLIVGIGNAGLNYTESTAMNSIAGSYSTTGFHSGVGMLYKINAETSIYSRYSFYYQTKDVAWGMVGSVPSGVDSIYRFELSYAQEIEKNFGLRIGYVFSVVQGYLSPNSVNFNLRTAGPVLAAALNF